MHATLRAKLCAPLLPLFAPLGQAKDELQKMLAEDELRDACLLVFANKQDLPNAMSTAEVTDKLGLHSMRQPRCLIRDVVARVAPQGSCATTGEGLYNEVHHKMKMFVEPPRLVHGSCMHATLRAKFCAPLLPLFAPLGQAKDELQKMLAEDELRDACLLVFANKQDLPNAMSTAEVTDKLGLHSMRQPRCLIRDVVARVAPQGSCATTGEGLYNEVHHKMK
eukprot:gene58330-biopygen26429